MRPYLEELISDMQESERKACRKRGEGGLTKGKDSSRIEPMFLSHEDLYSNPRKLEDIVGIPQAAFPPAHLLSLREKAVLAKSMEGLLNSWNFHPDFPEKLPWHMRYKHLRALWKSEQVYTGMGINYIDVCDFNESHCPFPNHCAMCNKIREQEKLYNKLMQKSNNPYRKK
ncbi:MAG TPA: hypothetical protein VJ876_02560 [Bacteroidales bacterium]|nr:hypothetical protein [Bacteroidales bacterium]